MTGDCSGIWFLQTTPDKRFWYVETDLLRGVNCAKQRQSVHQKLAAGLLLSQRSSLILPGIYAKQNTDKVPPRNWGTSSQNPRSPNLSSGLPAIALWGIVLWLSSQNSPPPFFPLYHESTALLTSLCLSPAATFPRLTVGTLPGQHLIKMWS